MRKFALLLIAISCFVMLNAQVATAQVAEITWFRAQHRIFEDGRDITKVIIQLEGLTKEGITSISFYEPDPGTPANPVLLNSFVTKDNAREAGDYSIFSNYYFNTGWATPDYYWDWETVNSALESDNWNYGYYLSWELYNHTLTDGGTYRIEVDYGSTTLSAEWVFPGYDPLPIVSLVSKKEAFRKSGGGKLDVEELPDGSLVLRWPARAVTHEDTSARIMIYLAKDRYVAFKAPTQLGMLIIPIDSVEDLKNSGYYNGHFDFELNIRINNDSERSYSNSKRYYP